MAATDSRTADLHQRHHDVEIHLDGNAYAWAWTPNTIDPERRLQIDLLPDLALYCHLGRGRRVEPPRWDDPEETTLIVSVDLGTNGTATIGSVRISDEAVCELATAGLLAAIHTGLQIVTARAGDTEGAARQT